MRVISGTSESVIELLTDRLKAELPGQFAPGGTMRVLRERPDRMREKNAEGLSVWLYLIEQDPERMNLPKRSSPPRQSHELLPLKAHYLVTPSVATGGENGAQVEQDILESVLRAFAERPLLRGANLHGGLAGTNVELRVRLEHLGIEALRTIWGAVGRPYDLSVSFEVDIEHQGDQP